jgi:hypothetical protein
MARLTGLQRHKIPASKFGLPGKGKGPAGKGAGSYPMPDKGHAEAAVGEAAAHASPGEKAEIDRKAAARFGVGPDAKGGKKPEREHKPATPEQARKLAGAMRGRAMP